MRGLVEHRPELSAKPHDDTLVQGVDVSLQPHLVLSRLDRAPTFSPQSDKRKSIGSENVARSEITDGPHGPSNRQRTLRSRHGDLLPTQLGTDTHDDGQVRSSRKRRVALSRRARVDQQRSDKKPVQVAVRAARLARVDFVVVARYAR